MSGFCPLAPIPAHDLESIVASAVAPMDPTLFGDAASHEAYLAECARIAPQTEAKARDLFVRTEAGDAEAADELFHYLPDHSRVALVRWTFAEKRDPAVLRAIVCAAWTHNNRFIEVAAYHERRTIVRWLERCWFLKPSTPSGRITIYRGTSGLSPAKAAKGLAWTTSYEVACRFAVAGDGEPLVLKRRIPTYEVLMTYDGRNEAEIVTASKAPAKPYGTPEEWRRRGLVRRVDAQLLEAV